MEFKKVTRENIDKEDICCAMSNNQSLLKKQWLKERFDEGLVFYKAEERGKCFIEYLPAENAWIPIVAPDYFYINCLWVAGSFKGHGYSNDLLNKCIDDAKNQGRKGLCILSSSKRKKEFLSDPKYLEYKGFKLADESDCGITLMYLPLVEDAAVPQFKPCAKKLTTTETGYVIYYTDQCPFSSYWVRRVVEVASENGISIKTIHISDKQTAQNMTAPVTTYALFRDGIFVTNVIQSDKKFLEFAAK